MMSTIYDKYQENSKDEYRWVLTTEIAKLRGPNPWPVPLNILQPIVGLMAFFCGNLKAVNIPRGTYNEKYTIELFGNMVLGFLKEKYGTHDHNPPDQNQEHNTKENELKYSGK